MPNTTVVNEDQDAEPPPIRTARKSDSELDGPTLARENRNVAVIFRQTMLSGFLSAVIGTFLPVFAVRAGSSTFQVSLMTALPALITVLLAIPGSAYAAKQPNLVKFVILTIWGSWGAYLLLPFVPSFFPASMESWVPYGIIVLYGVSAVFGAVSNPAWMAVVGEAFSRRRSPSVNGRRWAMAGTIGALSVFPAGWYLDQVRFPLNYQSLMVVATLIGIPGVIILDKVKPLYDRSGEPKRAPTRTWQMFTGMPRMFREQPAFARYIGSTVVYRLGQQLPVALFPIFWVDNLQASDATIGLRGLIAQGCLVVGYTVWGRQASKLGTRTIFRLASIGGVAYPILTGVAPSAVWIIFVAAIWGLYTGGTEIVFFEGLVESSPADQRVAYAAVHWAIINACIFTGPLLGLALVEIIGIRTTFIVAGVICLAGMILFSSVSNPQPTTRKLLFPRLRGSD